MAAVLTRNSERIFRRLEWAIRTNVLFERQASSDLGSENSACEYPYRTHRCHDILARGEHLHLQEHVADHSGSYFTQWSGKQMDSLGVSTSPNSAVTQFLPRVFYFDDPDGVSFGETELIRVLRTRLAKSGGISHFRSPIGPQSRNYYSAAVTNELVTCNIIPNSVGSRERDPLGDV